MYFFFKQLFFKTLALFLILFSSCSSNQGEQTVKGQVALTDQKQQKPGAGDEVQVDTLAGGLVHPWGMAFLPDGSLLVTERAGRLRILDTANNLSHPIPGVPEVYNKGQGGLLDIALHPDFKTNNYVYISFSEPGPNNTATTALGRGKLVQNRLKDFKVIFREKPYIEGENHFGSRIVFTKDGYLFLTLGERFQFEPAQNLSNHLGTIVRLNQDGSIPKNNPFVGKKNAEPAIWSYGHRNIESAAIDPRTGKLWIAEMGPKGGDELNQPEAGKNYGWPVVSWGEHYDGEDIPDPPTHPEFADAKIHWTPVISPSGMEFYTGSLFQDFSGNMLVGGLTAKGIVRVQVNGDQASEVGRINLGTRIRDVAQGPDGAIYLLTDQQNGNILKLTPVSKTTARVK